MCDLQMQQAARNCVYFRPRPVGKIKHRSVCTFGSRRCRHYQRFYYFRFSGCALAPVDTSRFPSCVPSIPQARSASCRHIRRNALPRCLLVGAPMRPHQCKRTFRCIGMLAHRHGGLSTQPELGPLAPVNLIIKDHTLYMDQVASPTSVSMLVIRCVP
jgi:hypothetical protein